LSLHSCKWLCTTIHEIINMALIIPGHAGNKVEPLYTIKSLSPETQELLTEAVFSVLVRVALYSEVHRVEVDEVNINRGNAF
jgi:hypothetical protein